MISTGLPHVNVPNVVGLTQAAATTALTTANLLVGASAAEPKTSGSTPASRKAVNGSRNCSKTSWFAYHTLR